MLGSNAAYPRVYFGMGESVTPTRVQKSDEEDEIASRQLSRCKTTSDEKNIISTPITPLATNMRYRYVPQSPSLIDIRQRPHPCSPAQRRTMDIAWLAVLLLGCLPSLVVWSVFLRMLVRIRPCMYKKWKRVVANFLLSLGPPPLLFSCFVPASEIACDLSSTHRNFKMLWKLQHNRILEDASQKGIAFRPFPLVLPATSWGTTIFTTTVQ